MPAVNITFNTHYANEEKRELELFVMNSAHSVFIRAEMRSEKKIWEETFWSSFYSIQTGSSFILSSLLPSTFNKEPMAQVSPVELAFISTMFLKTVQNILFFSVKFKSFIFLFLFLFMAVPAAHASSQARGQIRAAATSLCHSHSNSGSELQLWPILQHTPTMDP